VRAKLLAHKPAAVAFTSKNAGALFFGVRDIGYGRQPPALVAALDAGLRDIAYFVLASPSGRARSWWRIEPWQEAAAFVEARRQGRKA
jgi:double-stranded uracil-DNA glycosylase